MFRNFKKAIESIKEKVSEEHGINLTTDQVLKMEALPTNSASDYTIIGLQCGDLSILCWMTKDGLCHKVKCTAW